MCVPTAPGSIACMPTQAACDHYYSFETTPSPQSVPSVQQQTVTEYYPELEDDAAFHSDEEIQKVRVVDGFPAMLLRVAYHSPVGCGVWTALHVFALRCNLIKILGDGILIGLAVFMA